MDVSYIIAIWFLLLQCRLSLGECHCSVKSQCNLHQTTCESGCEAGFTGSRCQYENLLLGHILDPFYRRLVDGNMTNCFTYHRDIYARDITSADRVNTLRIRYAAGRKCGCKELELCKTQCPDGCRGGYMGPLCKYKCSVGYYEDGQDCTQCGAGCNGGCDGPNGHCTCKTGWTGTRCKRCSVGYYEDGQDCTQCGAGCNGVCDGPNGHCTCKTGWTGTRCNNCEGGYYMDRGDCVECGAGCDWGTCNANTGTCICRPGWRVPGCAILCPPGIYGEHCRLNCSAGCVNQTCDRVDGTCDVCLPGWNMAKCDNKVLMQTSGSCLPPFFLWSSITTIVTVGAAVLRPAILV
ncbi:scavenger receptor class F member 2-like isoform X3 [Haliotis rufescens]|uniref:scavenger receptor class F member 2-like isoform X3 n=1 Tax=Haliotis rufescens TaxID=6454 RepID=UPI00201EEEBB|nr:scavenger receptor class F member 2-like isoform X3 [Haliotis rufescens]